ncbi:acyl-CoA dehydrogenase [Novosphingobium flavum]|uniref:acyl-CoA dehydrogenase family protein n=1 Tax=Novosphingobium aerophilum TaxID=2839843 RepID=UPI0016396BB7|nr:acyl-CoA dehydrogenase family protein [Novosphingobium aerophilum]MBC2660310.1 acyl-CoA dehydrogenase [Novosphingobium aerophilum]
MNELLSPFDGLLEHLAKPEAIKAIETGASPAAMWRDLDESGFLDALVDEAHGGSGLALADVEPLIAAAGARAVPLPIAETMVARALIAAAGIAAPRGPIAIAGSAQAGQTVPLGLVAEHILLDTGTTLVLAARDDLTPAVTGVHRDLAARITWDGAPQGLSVARPDHGLRPIAAVLRATLIAGAAARLTEQTTAYANDRVQFGKPIGKQQALQQQLAVMAEDMIAARIAAQLGCAAGLTVSPLQAAVAKATASAVAPRIANTAHAVHGAIGISEEFALQLLTRRLHEWRLADGSEGYWTAVLGGARLADPAPSVDWVRARVFA